jgi:flagellin
MTVNNNINNYVGDVNSASSSALERVAAGLAINKASDDASGLAIADQLRNQKSSMAQSIDNANSGIAMSNIAQGGMREQQEILKNIKTETLKAMNGTTSAEGREAIANQINKYIDQYEQIAEQTNYNGQQLLKTSGDPAVDDMSISGEEEIVSLQAADTTSISDNLRTFMADFATNPDSMKNLLTAVDDGISTLSSYEGDFGSASNALESMARNYMAAETSTANAESVLRDLDFSEGIANFNKTNLQSQAGYFVQSQANAVQANVLRLLA